jgi:Tic22-like family
MMKSIIRSCATIGLIGSLSLGAWLSQTTKAFALTAEQVIQKLAPVPVFTVADEQGAPLVVTGENNAKVAGVFISQKDANDFIVQLQKSNPELAKQVRVVLLSLGEIFQLSQENEKEKNGLYFDYVPAQAEVESAKQVLSANGEKYQEGLVPLFVARAGKDKGYLTISRNNQPAIPFFFEKAQLQTLIDQFKKEKPELANSIIIEVVPLEGLIDTLQKSDNQLLSKIVLVPTQESIKLLQSIAEEQKKTPTNQTPTNQTPTNQTPTNQTPTNQNQQPK